MYLFTNAITFFNAKCFEFMFGMNGQLELKRPRATSPWTQKLDLFR